MGQMRRQASPPRDNVPARLLQWDSEFFGVRIATVTASRLTSQVVEQLRSWCSQERIDCLYFLSGAEDVGTMRLAEDNGFRVTDIRLTLARYLNDPIAPLDRIRIAKSSDIPHLKQLAAKSFVNTRFYNDGHFAEEKCAELYSTWVERSCNGYADCVLIAEREDGRPAGFITCSLQESEGVIGLLAVDPLLRSHGLGLSLTQAALRYFREQRKSCARVVTQGCNIASQRLYQRCGFVTDLVQIWYHVWCTEARAWNPGLPNRKS